MKIAVVHNRSDRGVIARFGQPCPEKYGEKTILKVAESLRWSGHEVATCEGDKNLFHALEDFMPAEADGSPGGLVFNMAYGIQGECRYVHVPAMLEMAGIPYTGSSPLGHALALDKVITKDLLQQAGVPTPAYCVMRSAQDRVGAVRFPVVVKPRHESTSFGLRLADNQQDLREAVEYIVEKYEQDALVEEYIHGREFCVGLLGNGVTAETLPIVEQDFGDRGLRLVTYDDKYHKSSIEPVKRCPADIDPDLAQRLRQISLATFQACFCRDYSRVDIRVDERGRPWVLEINSMASLGAGGSYVFSAQAAGYCFEALINRIVQAACGRYAGLGANADLCLTA